MSNTPIPLNVPEFSVSEISTALKRAVEDNFGYIRVRGEISQPKVAASGHCYMRLKDESAVIDAIIWRGSMGKIGHRPEEGMEVVASGRLTTYPGRSSYQIIIESFELAGAGALLKLLEDRRKNLAAEGLFDEARKRPLPSLPDVIGVVTSPTGAVIRDILHRLYERFPRRVILWPVRVQGEGAKDEITKAIEGFNALDPVGHIPRPDVLIIARGGGSLEDLWVFNEELVVRAAAKSEIPVISAIGHETDTTLIDFAADRRAATPTAAAEMAVPVRLDLITQIQDSGSRLSQAVGRLLSESRLHIDGLARGLPNLTRLVEQKQQDMDVLSERLVSGPSRFLLAKTQELAISTAGLKPTHIIRYRIDPGETQLADWSTRLISALMRSTDSTRERLNGLVARLDSVSPRKVLERGYALVTNSEGTPVTLASEASDKAYWKIEFQDGPVEVTVGYDGKAPVKRSHQTKIVTQKPTGNRQGKLL
ncbi:MAG: exodeoxyribonuclease VII large subunit [Rhodospirillaceae bacterium]